MPSNRCGHHTLHKPRLFSGLAAEIALVTDTIPRWVRTRVDGFDPSLDTVTVRWPAAQPWWGQLSPAARALIAVACEFDAMYLAEAVVLSCVTTEPRQILLGQLASWQRLQRRDNVRQPVAVFPLSILHCRERKRFPITGTIRDVSAGGLMLCVDHEVQRGDSLAVQFTLPGDTLEIRILRMVPYPYGVNFVLPGSAGAGTLPEEFPEGRVKSFEWRDGAEHLPFASGIRVPLRPFLGSMAVAPAASGRVSAVPPGPYGGNLDLKELSEGATLYLPVFVSGGLFSAGDAHAVQGDGEVNTSAVETAMREAQLQFVLRKDLKLQLPMAETPTHWIAMGFHQDLDEAARIALRQAIAWLVQSRGLGREDAYSLCSLAVDMRITQLVNREKGVHAMIPKAIFTN